MTSRFFACGPQGLVREWVPLKEADTGLGVGKGGVDATLAQSPRGEPCRVPVDGLQNDDAIAKDCVENVCLRAGLRKEVVLPAASIYRSIPRLIVANCFKSNLKLLKRIGVAEINANVGKRTHKYMGM